MKEPAQAPRQLKGKPLGASVAAGEVPTLAQLGLQPVTRIPGTSHVRGGARCLCLTFFQPFLCISHGTTRHALPAAD